MVCGSEASEKRLVVIVLVRPWAFGLWTLNFVLGACSVFERAGRNQGGVSGAKFKGQISDLREKAKNKAQSTKHKLKRARGTLQ
jgi:hypothetical protein